MDIPVHHYENSDEKRDEEKDKQELGEIKTSQNKFVQFFKKPIPKAVWITIFVIIFLAGLGLAAWIWSTRFDEGKTPKQAASNKVASPLNGVQVPEDVAKLRPFAVVIENSPEARPQTGLGDADLVYEAVAEGGITRFVALYANSEPSELGPVRSARSYFVDWITPFEAFYAHCGGSAEALAQLKNEKPVIDLDQFQYAQSYWRVSTRYAPHNLYTSIAKLKEAAALTKASFEKKYEALKFKSDAPLPERPAQAEVNVGWGFSYAVRWVYDAKTNNYARFMAGQAHNDAKTGKQITAKTIIVEVHGSSDPPEAVGEGKVIVFRDGKKIEGTWEKATKQDRTKYYDENGKPIELTAGLIWIEIVSDKITVN